MYYYILIYITMDFYAFLDEDSDDEDNSKNKIKPQPQPVQIPPKKKYFKFFK